MGNQKKKARALKYFIGGVLFLTLAAVGINHFWLGKSDNAILSARFETTSGSSNEFSSVFKLEIVNTPQARARGLMFRREMASNRGMIFIFPESDNLSFYMKNTYISLDIIFVNEEMKVVGFLENLPILNQESRSIGSKSRYAIELLAGTVKKLGLKPGDKVIFGSTLPSST